MSTCELCGEESNKVTECTTCLETFCDECGETKRKLCAFCNDDDDDQDEKTASVDPSITLLIFKDLSIMLA